MKTTNRKLGKFQQKVLDTIPEEGITWVELSSMVTPFVHYGYGLNGHFLWSTTKKALEGLVTRKLIVVKNWGRTDCMIYKI